MHILSANGVRASLSAAFLSIVVFASAPSASAQGTRVRVDVPFSFEVGSQHMKPGVYTMQFDNQFLVIRGNTSGATAMAARDESRIEATKSTVLFRKYGNHAFLAEIRTKGHTSYLKCVKTHSEKQVELAALNQPAPSGVELALLEPTR